MSYELKKEIGQYNSRVTPTLSFLILSFKPATTGVCSILLLRSAQVVTGCDSSTIAVWDIETGNKSIVFSNAHGDEEITCMAFDSTNRRLISGARNGSVKVWRLI